MRHAVWAGSAFALACGLAVAACADELVQDVPTDVCASGKRWAGKLTGNEEMYPGHDCVGCHKDYDGPEFMAAGTVYGVIDLDGALTTRNDCFGVEGAHVKITAGDGQVLETTTNRAGNFYFEGRLDALVKPLSVVVEYTAADGRFSREPMGTHPSYGGCAHCHNPDAVDTGAEPGLDLGPNEVVGNVAPIFTGPVDP